MPAGRVGERGTIQRPCRDLEVVGDLERPEAAGTDVVRRRATPARPQFRQRMPRMRSAREPPSPWVSVDGHRHGRPRRWDRRGGQQLGRHRSVLRAVIVGRGRTGGIREDPSCGGRASGVPLSRRRTCPDLAPCRRPAGRLSWLQRAGPSATLDKNYSVAFMLSQSCLDRNRHGLPLTGYHESR